MPTVNRFHRRYCASQRWAEYVERDLLPWALQDVELGEDVLEIGPGLGVTTRLLSRGAPQLTAVEVDEGFVGRLRGEFGASVAVVHGDGAAMPLPADRFSAAVCFTMLHHVPSAEQQDAIFAEVHRVLRPGGVFAGSDSQPSLRFRLIHLFDTMVTIDPEGLPQRLSTAGFENVSVATGPRGVRFFGTKPL